MDSSELQRLRDAYVAAFNAADFEALEALLHPEASYRWVAANRAEQGRTAVMALYRQGHQAFAGKSRLGAVSDTADQAIWYQPTCCALEPAGLQTLSEKDGKLFEIADLHDPAQVAAAAPRVAQPPKP